MIQITIKEAAQARGMKDLRAFIKQMNGTGLHHSILRRLWYGAFTRCDLDTLDLIIRDLDQIQSCAVSDVFKFVPNKRNRAKANGQ